MDSELRAKFNTAAQGLGLNDIEKKLVLAWYKDDMETIRAMPVGEFRMLMKQYVLLHLRINGGGGEWDEPETTS